MNSPASAHGQNDVKNIVYNQIPFRSSFGQPSQEPVYRNITPPSPLLPPEFLLLLVCKSDRSPQAATSRGANEANTKQFLLVQTRSSCRLRHFRVQSQTNGALIESRRSERAAWLHAVALIQCLSKAMKVSTTSIDLLLLATVSGSLPIIASSEWPCFMRVKSGTFTLGLLESMLLTEHQSSNEINSDGRQLKTSRVFKVAEALPPGLVGQTHPKFEG